MPDDRGVVWLNQCPETDTLLAAEEARNHPTSEQGDVGSEHLLLGLYREEETVTGQFLRQVGVSYEAICERLPSDTC